jgi:hypothetical protein
LTSSHADARISAGLSGSRTSGRDPLQTLSTLARAASSPSPSFQTENSSRNFADYFGEIANLKTMGAIAITEAAEIATGKSDRKAPDQLIAKATEGK